jgi:hypothetical protein
MNVFMDEGGTVPVQDVVIVSHPTLRGDSDIAKLAQDNGVMKALVAGLKPGSTYHYQTVTTSKVSGETAFYPDSPPFPTIETEGRTVRHVVSGEELIPFANDLLVAEVYLDDGETPAEGTIVVATVDGASYPLSSFVGDSISPPFVILDLNNVFDSATRENLGVAGGESATLVNLRGFLGSDAASCTIPPTSGLALAVAPIYASSEHCGDEIVQWQQGEECEAGVGNECGVYASCVECRCVPKDNLCGDGIIQWKAGEQCEPGVGSCGPYRECINCLCVDLSFCGDGVVNWRRGEECEPGVGNECGPYGDCIDCVCVGGWR